MPTRLARILLFLSSYSPLLIVFGLRNPFSSPIAEGVLYGGAAISILTLVLFIRQGYSLEASSIELKSASNRDSEAMTYVVTYFIPFLGVSYTDISSVISLLLVYVVICIIYVSANLIHTNPILNLIGYHLYEIEDQDGKPGTLITKREYVGPNDRIKASSLSNYILLERR